MPTLPSTMDLSLLNGFRLCRNMDPIRLPLSAQRLIAFVALRDRPLSRLEVAGSLWPEVSERRSNGSLRSTLWRLRQKAGNLVRATAAGLKLDTTVTVDFRQASAVIRTVLVGPPNRQVTLSPYLLEPGDLLAGWYDDWVLLERERFRQLRLRALELTCQQLAESGRVGEAIFAGSTAVATEPLRETARRVLIQAYLAEGNYAEALGQYRAYRQMLRVELGLEPSPHIKALIAGLPSSPTA